MLDWLKRAYYRKTRSPDEAALILRVERAIEALPSSLVTEKWCRSVWSLPPDAWEEAVELRRRPTAVALSRENAVRAITRMNRLRSEAPDSPEAMAAKREVEALKEELFAYEKEYCIRIMRFEGRWGSPPS